MLAKPEHELGHHLVVVQDHEFLGLVAICELKRMPPEETVRQLARSPLFTLEENDPVSLPLRHHARRSPAACSSPTSSAA